MEANCTLLVATPDKVGLPNQAQIHADLESQDPARKVNGLKGAILLLLAGEDMPRILMTVIRYCITVEDHTLQKLLMMYWEVARKYDSTGKLLPEMILVCNALRNNLIHPNEYIRGATLRFLCKLQEPELLEPLVPSIKNCLSHRHPYVRRNAILAAYSVYKSFKDLYPDAPEEIEKVLSEETDAGARRNAFVMMFNVAQDKALAYLAKNIEKVHDFGDGFALILLDLIRKVVTAASRSTASFTSDASSATALDPARKAKFIRVVFSLLESPSAAVVFEAAQTLTSLSAAPSAVKAAAGAYIKILSQEADNNVKLIVLDRLAVLRRRHAKTLREMVMDILRSLSTPNNDIRRKVLDVAMDLVSPRNVEEVMALLKREILSTSSAGSSSSSSSSSGSSSPDAEASRYRSMLISAIHGCAVRFPEVAPAVVHLLMDFLAGDVGASSSLGPGHPSSALTVIEFAREIVETFPDMRNAVLSKLRSVLPEVGASDVYRVALWLLGQYSESDADVQAAIHAIRECVGPLPLTTPYAEYAAAAAAAAAGVTAAAPAEAASGRRGPVVLADGTYASQPAASVLDKSTRAAADAEVTLPGLRRLLLAGDFFLASVVASTLTKLALRVGEHHGRDSRAAKAVSIDAMLAMCALLELGASGQAGTTVLLPASAMPAVSRGGYRPGTGSGLTTTPSSSGSAASAGNGVRIDQDSFERIVLCMRVLGDPASSAAAMPVLLHTCRDTFSALLVDRRARAAQAAKDGVATHGASGLPMLKAAAAEEGAAKGAGATGAAAARAQADDRLSLRLLRPNRSITVDVLEDDYGTGGGADIFSTSLTSPAGGRAPGGGAATEAFSERLKRVHQLTGFADPVYCEAYVAVREYDIVMEMTLINRTDTTLTNVTVELSTMGDLRLVERPATFTLGPRDAKTVKANIKVASTESGHIFGTIVYDSAAPGSSDRNVVNLSEIHVDIMDYIHPAVCSDAVFRSMWADFEWENKVTVNTNMTNLQAFVNHIAKSTNMRVLTPIAPLAGSNFLAANLYARSIFGEDALVNISVENKADGTIRGHVRIRAKTQGVALSLGDRITSKQKV